MKNEKLLKKLEEVLADDEIKKLIIHKLFESYVIKDPETLKELEEELIYDATCLIDDNMDMITCNFYHDIKNDSKFAFVFKYGQDASKWAKKLSALNKLRMIKELIDNTEESYFFIKWCYDEEAYVNQFYTMPKEMDKSSSFTIKFSSGEKCSRAIELMGKEALDDLFIDIN